MWNKSPRDILMLISRIQAILYPDIISFHLPGILPAHLLHVPD